MGSWLIRPVEPGDADALAANLRPGDVEEIRAGASDDVHGVVRFSAERSRYVWTALHEGEIVLLIGTAELEPDLGCIWLLATTLAERFPGALTKISKAHIAFVTQSYPRLKNYVYAQSTRNVRWLARLGFTIHPPEPYGPRGELFHPFTMGH